MKIIGITGGVGSGKSKVLQYLKIQPGVVVYEADQIARELQQSGTECFTSICNMFGDIVIGIDGELNRTILREKVFSDSKELLKLNQIVHPAVRKRVEDLIEEAKQHEDIKVFVLEAAILLEANYGGICHEIWYIYCDESIRMKRLQDSRNYTKEVFRDICSQQLSESQFQENCTITINNSYDEHDLKEKLSVELHRIMEL